MKRQLFLLHFAGGNCYSYNFLKPYLNVGFELIPLELPGRGKRFQENLLRNKEEAILDYVNQIKNLRNKKPYIIFGHSMGATLGLSITAKMEALGDPPIRLVVSGNAGPHEQDTEDEKRYLLSDEAFKKVLKKLGGIPKEVFENQELYDFFGPVLRADFEVLEKDEFSEKNIALTTPIIAIMGCDEERFEQIDNWARYTRSNFNAHTMEGNHFFIFDHPKGLSDIIFNATKVQH